MSDIIRHLASIRKIQNITSIPDADNIVCAQVDGWKVVVRKDQFEIGDLAVYFEIDSWIPESLAPFLTKPNHRAKEFNDVVGNQLKTIKLRNQISQGLLMALSILPDGCTCEIGSDVTKLLGIQKYEPPVPPEIRDKVKGIMPGFLVKTDQQRCQNLSVEINQWSSDSTLTWEATEKLDGISITFYQRDGEIGMCGRNYEFKFANLHSISNVNLETMFADKTANIAIQGEKIGQGSQANKYKLSKPTFYVFDIFDIDNHRYFTPAERQKYVQDHNLLHVPILNKAATLSTIDELLADADGKSIINPQLDREGIVFKANNGKGNFKAISNKFLLKYSTRD
jgi:RNA ligase (TIGR02306 family)